MGDKAASDQQISDGEEQSSDQATGDRSGVVKPGAADGEESTEEAEEPEEGSEESEEETTELIPKEQYDKLKSDPDKLHKELVRAANKKFREAADQKKALQPYAAFIGELDADPRKAITDLATRLGMKIEGTEPTKEAKEDVEAAILVSVKQALGPEFEELAERLIPAISAVTDSMVKQALKPILDKQDEIIMDSATKSSQVAMDTFAKSHPDWKKHEESMVEMSRRFPPGENVTEADYLESIYFLVTRDKNEGSAVRKTVDKMRKAAQESNTRSSVSGDKVSVRSIAPPTFREAAAAAIRGERLE